MTFDPDYIAHAKGRRFVATAKGRRFIASGREGVPIAKIPPPKRASGTLDFPPPLPASPDAGERPRSKR